MNRRHFITTFSAGVAASIFLPRAVDAFKWRRSSAGGMWIVNPAWKTATYEYTFWNAEGTQVIFPHPARFELRGGVLWPVPLFKKITA